MRTVLLSGTFLFAALLAASAVAQVGAVNPSVPDPDLPDLTGQEPRDDPVPPIPGADGALSPGDFVSQPSFVVGVGLGLAVAATIGWLMFQGGAKFVTSENVLDNETRYGLYEFLRRAPGSHLREISATLQLSTTNALWHLRKLEEADLIRAQKVEGYKVFYPVEGGIEGKRQALARAALKKENAQEILQHVADHPGTHQREMARAIGVNHGTVRWHLRKMVNAGLLLQIKREHATLYYLTELGAQTLSREAPAPPVEAPPPSPPWLGSGAGVAEA